MCGMVNLAQEEAGYESGPGVVSGDDGAVVVLGEGGSVVVLDGCFTRVSVRWPPPTPRDRSNTPREHENRERRCRHDGCAHDARSYDRGLVRLLAALVVTRRAALRPREPEALERRFRMNVHGDTDSHIDVLCHVIYDDKLYNDVSVDTFTPTGASTLTIETVHDGIVGRGVLLEIPRVRGISWLEPGDHVTVDDLAAAETARGLRVKPGDLLFVRVGHSLRRYELGPWNAADARAGLHPTAMEFVAERRVAALGSDGNSDTAPSTTEGVAFPVHVLAINAMGVHLLDYLRFEDLVALCEVANRWSFLCVIAPLRLPAATGSPINAMGVHLLDYLRFEDLVALPPNSSIGRSERPRPIRRRCTKLSSRNCLPRRTAGATRLSAEAHSPEVTPRGPSPDRGPA
jgi:kynurenine formamidase